MHGGMCLRRGPLRLQHPASAADMSGPADSLDHAAAPVQSCAAAHLQMISSSRCPSSHAGRQHAAALPLVVRIVRVPVHPEQPAAAAVLRLRLQPHVAQLAAGRVVALPEEQMQCASFHSEMLVVCASLAASVSDDFQGQQACNARYERGVTSKKRTRNTGPSGVDAAQTLEAARGNQAALLRWNSRPLCVMLSAALKCGMQPMGSQDSWGNWIWGNDKCWGGDINSNPWNGCWGSLDNGLWDKVR